MQEETQNKSSLDVNGKRVSDEFGSQSEIPIDFLGQLERQNQEINPILHVEGVGSNVQEHNNVQMYMQVKLLERKAMFWMKQKEETLAEATRKSLELEACLKRATMEAESWQKLSEHNSDSARKLNSVLKRVRKRNTISKKNMIEDAMSRIHEERNGDDEDEMTTSRFKRCCVGSSNFMV